MANVITHVGLVLVLTFCSAAQAQNKDSGRLLVGLEYFAAHSITNVKYFVEQTAEFRNDKSRLISDHLINMLAPESLGVSVTIIRTPKLISLATEGNEIVISTGLIGSLSGVGEFAAILAKELAHISLGHYAARDSYRGRAMAISRTLGPLTLLAASKLSNDAVDDFFIEQELEAGEVARRYLSNAGFSVKYLDAALASILENVSTDDPFYFSHPNPNLNPNPNPNPNLHSDIAETPSEGQLQDLDGEGGSVFETEFVELSKIICEINIPDNLRYRRLLSAKSAFDKCISASDEGLPSMRFLNAVIARRIVTYVEHIKFEMASMPSYAVVLDDEIPKLIKELTDWGLVSAESNLKELTTVPGFEAKAMLELGEFYYDLGEFEKSLLIFDNLGQFAQPGSRWFVLAESFTSAISKYLAPAVVEGDGDDV